MVKLFYYILIISILFIISSSFKKTPQQQQSSQPNLIQKGQTILNSINNKPLPLHQKNTENTNPTKKTFVISNNNNNHNNNNNTDKIDFELYKKQKLSVIAYASDDGPARHLKSFAKRYDLDFHLIGVNKPWRGFNDKINGFYNFIESIDNRNNDSIILILDAYDTVPICSSSDLLIKFNKFASDIVISTGKDCWPDPNVGSFLYEHLLNDEDRNLHKFFPWFLCPNSGAIMGKHDAMLSMFGRVQKLVSLGNGSCEDFEGNKFSTNTQSDQRCYTTYFVELTKYHEYERELINKTKKEQKQIIDRKNDIIDISKLENINGETQQSADGTISKHYFLHNENDRELTKYYKDITMKLDYNNDLFLSMGGMMFMDIDVTINDITNISIRSKITNGSSCILHGNGPGVILWRSYVKQIANSGNLYIDDYVLRVGVDFFHWILWWIIMPAERLSHWLSVTYHIDLGIHSTTFSEEVIWRFHVWSFVAVIIIIGTPLLYWYKYQFRRNMKMKQKNKYDKRARNNRKKKAASKQRKREQNIQNNNNHNTQKQNRNNRFHTNILNNNHPITQQLVKGLVNLEIMVHHNGNTFPLLKTQKTK